MKKRSAAHARTRIAIGILMAFGAGSASAIEFEVGDGWRGAWNTTIAFAQGWRAQAQDPGLFGKQDGLIVGKTNGLGGTNTDSGNLNFDRGDTIFQVFKLTSEVGISKNGTGALVRFKAWYDYALDHNNVHLGNSGQRPAYTPEAPLSDEGLAMENRFLGIKLLDAYAYTEFKVGESPLQVRLGNQVVNWGESLFLQGLNYTSPIDVVALRRGAGTEIKEFLLPVPIAYANLGLPNGQSVEAYYQLQWQRTVIDACGSFFAPAEGATSYQPGNCAIGSAFGPGSNQSNVAAGRFVQLVEGVKGSNSDNYGLTYRFPISALDTEFGLSYQHLSSRTPVVSVRTGAVLPAAPGVPLFAFGLQPNALVAYWEYPNDIQVFGLSAATNIAGWSVGGEVSYWKDVPNQMNGADLINGFVGGVGPLGPAALALAGRLPGTTPAPVGTKFNGYTLFDNTKFQVNAVKLFSNVMGADNLTVVGEYGAQWANVPDYKDGGIRYGRGFIYGLGSYISGAPPFPVGFQVNTCTPPAPSLLNPQPDGCQNNGYVTPFADGFRLRGTLTYNNVWNSGVAIIPSLFWGYDLHGVSIDSQFNEGRSTVALAVKFDYNKKYALDLGYVTYGNSGTYDNFRDHDFYSAAVSVTF